MIDVDAAEIAKHANNRGFTGTQLDIAVLPEVLEGLSVTRGTPAWRVYVDEMKSRVFRPLRKHHRSDRRHVVSLCIGATHQ